MPRHTLPLLLAATLLAAAPVHAAKAFQTAGPQFGFSAEPSQVVFGGHLSFGNVAPELDFVPSVDVGVGDDLTVVSINGDFHYRIRLAGYKWQPYAGAGVALHTASGGGRFGGSSTVGGGNVMFGADVPTGTGSRFNAEIRVGLGDGPDLKMLAGWSFPLK